MFKYLFLFILIPFYVFSLSLSKDSINAYDGIIWQYPAYDDSIEIINSGIQSIFIDSIHFIINSPIYDTTLSIGWQIKNNRFDTTYIFNKGVYSSPNCSTRSIQIDDYNNGLYSNIIVKSNDTITMFTPNLSNNCSAAGRSLFGLEPWPHYDIFITSYTGYVTFFTSNNEFFSIKLLCKKYVYVLNVCYKLKSISNISTSYKSTFYNYLGRKINTTYSDLSSKLIKKTLTKR
jgi:hypothetical protein